MPTHKIVGHPPKGRRKADGTTPTRNKGVLRARRLQKREEAEARNAKTKPERRRAARRK